MKLSKEAQGIVRNPEQWRRDEIRRVIAEIRRQRAEARAAKWYLTAGGACCPSSELFED